jgi:hypothetical protein
MISLKRCPMASDDLIGKSRSAAIDAAPFYQLFELILRVKSETLSVTLGGTR